MTSRYKEKAPRSGGVDLTRELKDLSDLYELDPVEILFEFLDHDKDDYRFAAARELMQYMYPKQKAIEITGTVTEYSSDDEITDEELEQIAIGKASSKKIRRLAEEDLDEDEE